MFRRAVLVSLTNPKTLFFYGAFLPQFVSPSHAILPQLAVLSGAFLGIALIIDSLWAVTAHQARCWLIRHGAWIDRASGSVLIGAGLSLAFARGK
jgi:threonine/homoserine/homoserine lactone efflux protein